MKAKHLLFSLLLLGSSTGLSAQNGGNLITNATFSVPSDSSITFYGAVNYVLSGSDLAKFPVESDEWQYIAITKNENNEGKIYKNGQLVAQGTFEDNSYVWNRLDLGVVYYTSYFLWYKGLIDEIRVSNTIRSSESIAETYASNSPFEADGNTIGLWNLNQSSGNQILASAGPDGTITNAEWSEDGRFGNCLSFNGIDARGSIPISIPTTTMTFEIWIKPNGLQYSYSASWYGMYTTGISTNVDTLATQYLWSTGETTNEISVDPTNLDYIWVTDGNVTDTVFFNSINAIVYDTVYVSVTDTLIIEFSLTGIEPPNNSHVIKIFPNPTSESITIDYGDYTLMQGYSVRIYNVSGQQVYYSQINEQSSNINLSSWTGTGLYFVHLIDNQEQTITVRKILLQ